MSSMHSSATNGASEPGLLAAFDRWLSPIETAFNFVAAICILTLMFMGVAQIAGRTILDMPIWGYIDIVELAMATFAFLGIAYCQRQGGHVRMELALNYLKGRSLYTFEMLSTLAGLFIIGVLVWYGMEHSIRAYENGDSTIDAQYPLWPSKALVPLSFSLLWLRLLLQLFGFIRLMADPEATPIGVPIMEDVETQARKEAADAQATADAKAAKSAAKNAAKNTDGGNGK